ncbi:MAG: N-acetyltransferase family protein [Vicinamibacterales bacterium]
MIPFIRRAVLEDIEALVTLTLEEARDAEGLQLDAAAVRRGVEGAFQEPPRAAYWVAESADGHIVASTSIVTEWSNFHGGEYWWVQSLYITPTHRGHGLVERLLDRLWTEALAAGALDLRLYAHRGNARALRAYERCGFTTAPYVIMARPTGEGSRT